MSLTTDKNDPQLNEKRENGQNKAYLVLSEEERAKGYVRPVRTTYVHVGRDYRDTDPQPLDEPFVEEHNNKNYVAKYVALRDDDGTPKGWGYLTEEQMEQYQKNDGFIGGCGTPTTMSHEIAETYARDPKFYGATFCVNCRTHISVNEFVWEGTDEQVGS